MFFLFNFQVPIFCNSSSMDCFWKQAERDRQCMKSCSGLYADVWSDKTERANFEDELKLQKLEDEYGQYKSKFAENLVFDRDANNYGRFFKLLKSVDLKL